MRHKLRPLALVLALAPLGAGAACQVNAPNLSFGPYDPLSGAGATTSGVIVVSCDSSPPPDVRLQIGPSAVSGGYFPRRMRADSGSDTIAYNFYADPGAGSVWGDGSGGTVTQTRKVLKNSPWSATVYGMVPAGQDVSVGAYADSVTITIIF